MEIITLTKQVPTNSQPSTGQRSQITDAMLSAGVEEYLSRDREGDDAAAIVLDVFQAMVEAQYPATQEPPQ